MERPIKKAKSPISPTRTIFVGGIPLQTTRDELLRHFASFGHLEQVFFPVCKMTLANKGYAFILFSTVEEATKAVILEGGHKIRAKEVTSKAGRSVRKGRQG